MDRHRELAFDGYYMDIAGAVRSRANCTGQRVGAVLVIGNRIVSTGYNGTPAGFTNCLDGGCVRCADPARRSGRGLDVCICVHAEQNALLAAARFGAGVDGATLYSTLNPCFGCLKEAIQAGVGRIVYRDLYPAAQDEQLQAQYAALVAHLCAGDETRFERLAPVP